MVCSVLYVLNVGLPVNSILFEVWLTWFTLSVATEFLSSVMLINVFMQAKLVFPDSWLSKEMHRPYLMLLQIVG